METPNHRRSRYDLRELQPVREPRSRALNPSIAETCGEEAGLWYESPEDVEDALDWGERKAILMMWVRRQMTRRLTARERRAVHLYYLEQLSYRKLAAELGTTTTSAFRLVREGIDKLRRAARFDPPPVNPHRSHRQR